MASAAGAVAAPPGDQRGSLLDLYTVGTRAWVQDSAQGWAVVRLEAARKDGSLVFVREDKTGADVVVTPQADLSNLPPLLNPPVMDGVDDLTTLSYLHEPAVLHNVRIRYANRMIYSYSGIVLVAMNPYERLNIYDYETVRAYAGVAMGHLEPHLFAVAENAFRCMAREGHNQSIIVTGESGAGKTVSTKYVMRYLASVESHDASMTEIEEQVMATNPVMEAFGNAKTIRNNNSSRFGKYIQIMFNERNKIVAANIRTFLLERSRVIFQANDERGYHIFYQLLAGCPAAERKELHLSQDPLDYRLINAGGCPTVDDVNDAADFGETTAAFSKMGVSVTEQWKVFRVLAALLHLGNLQIGAFSRRDESAAIPADDASLKHASDLLQVDSAAFSKWICSRQIQTRSELIVTNRTASEASAARDAIVKYIYAQLFDWLVSRINAALMPTKHVGRFIGLLDIYGFEIFKVNSFEQFCINYANEKLQQEFVQHVFKLEQELYTREQIAWSYIDYADNQPCIELIEGRGGVFALLDEECKMPKGTDATFAAKLAAQHGSHSHFGKMRFGGAGFVINHYAQPVKYDCNGFLDKNRDTITEEQLAVLLGSKEALFAQIFVGKASASSRERPADGAPVKMAATPTLGAAFRSSVAALMETIRGTTSHYIRCIKPNDTKAAFLFDAPLVLNQLRACGVLETIKISAAGYPSRSNFSDFSRRYRYLVHSSQWQQPPRDLCTAILAATINDPNLSQIGQTKVFMRAGQLAILEKRRHDRLRACAILIQKNMLRTVRRRRYLALRAAAIVFQRWTRGMLARKRYQNLRRKRAYEITEKHVLAKVYRRRYLRSVASVRALQLAIRTKAARLLCSRMQQRSAAVRIQASFRASMTRRWYLRVRAAIIRCQAHIRRRLAYRELKALRMEARDITKYREASYRLEMKVMELSQALEARSDEAKAASRERAAAEERARAAADRLKLQQAQNESLLHQLAALKTAMTAALQRVETLEARTEELERKRGEDAEAAAREASEAAARTSELSSTVAARDANIAALQAQLEALRGEHAAARQRSEQRLKEEEEARLRAAVALGESKEECERLAALLALAVAAITRKPSPLDPRLAPLLDSREDLEDALPAAPEPTPAAASEAQESEATAATAELTEHDAESALATSAAAVALSLASAAAAPADGHDGHGHDWVVLNSAAPRINLEADFERELVLKMIVNGVPPVASAVDGVLKPSEMVYPAHVMGHAVAQLLVTGNAERVSRFVSTMLRAIQQVAINTDDLRLLVWWFANALEFRNIVHGLLELATNPHGRKLHIGPPPARLASKLTGDTQLLAEDVFATVIKVSKDRLERLLTPAIFEYEPVHGQRRRQGGGFLFFARPAPAVTPHNIILTLREIADTMLAFRIESRTYQHAFSALLYFIGGYTLNQMLLRKELCRPQKAQEIMHNILALVSWCHENGFSEAVLHLQSVQQACALLGLNLTSPLDVDEVTDRCFLLSSNQIHKLLSHFRTDDQDRACHPQILEAIRRTAVGDTRSLLTDTVGGHARYTLPPAENVPAIDSYLPPTLQLDCLLRN